MACILLNTLQTRINELKALIEQRRVQRSMAGNTSGDDDPEEMRCKDLIEKARGHGSYPLFVASSYIAALAKLALLATGRLAQSLCAGDSPRCSCVLSGQSRFLCTCWPWLRLTAQHALHGWCIKLIQ